MEYTAQNLEYAVSVFYNGEQTDRANAHSWLAIAQRAPEAWNFVWELLQPNKGTEIQFYAATTLHTKILRCWNELPPESHEELKNKILEAILTYSKGPKIVTNRLCISLAAFVLQHGAIDLITLLRPLAGVENHALLLEVLTVIPEEFNSMTMVSSVRAKNRASLQLASPVVLDDMLRYLETVYNPSPPSEQTLQSWVTAATCATGWLVLGGADVAAHARGTLPDRMPLCRALLTIVHQLYTGNPVVSDSALEACEACLGAVRAAGSGAATVLFPQAALQLLSQVSELASHIMARDNVANSINEELVAAVITCCVSLGECHAGALVEAAEGADRSEGASGARRLLQLILAAQATPGHYPLHETRSNLVFGFWYTLQDEILHTIDRHTKVHPVWQEVFSQLLTTLVIKAEAPTDVQLSKQDYELLRCYRQDITDTVMYCYGVLGEWVWETVESAFKSGGAARREAALHVLAALSDVAPARHAPPALRALLTAAVHIANTDTDKRMLNTALDCLGGYAGWLGTVQEAAGARLAQASVAAAGAALARCPAPAALALRKLCADCGQPAAALVADIVRAAQSPESRADAWVRRQLVGAAGAALAAAEPAVAEPLLHGLAVSLENDLRAQASAQSTVAEGACGAAESCAALLAALVARAPLAAALFRTIAPALPPYARHPRLVESMFHILKQVVSSLMENCLPMVADMGQLIIAGFNTCPCASGLDVVKLVVLVIGDEWEGSSNLLHTSVSASARMLASDPAARPDVIEGLFTLLQAITKKKPQYIDWIEDVLADLIDLGCGCVRMWDAGGSRAACWWLAALVVQRPHSVQHAAPAITTIALSCIGGGTPRSQIDPLAELLLSMNRAEWAGGAGGELAGWLRHALAAPGFPSAHATDAHKQKFIMAVLKEKGSKRRLMECVQEFSLVCRGLVNTEYGRQTFASKKLVT